MLTTPELLTLFDRDSRAAYWAQFWKRQRLTPNEALRLAIVDGLTSQEDDPGQTAGDSIMTLAAERGLDTQVHDLYGCAVHHAALADILVTKLRSTFVFNWRPEDVMVNTVKWVSDAWRGSTGTRLYRILTVDRWSEERKEHEKHSYFSLGEVCAYQMPMTMIVLVVGQTREGRKHSPWSKGYLHPRFNSLRLRRKSGGEFQGGWTQIWREERDEISRDKWLDTIQNDGLFPELMLEVEVPLPCKEIQSKFRRLIEKKLTRLSQMKETPEPNPSQCWQIGSPCPFIEACWNFTEPSEKNGFIST